MYYILLHFFSRDRFTIKTVFSPCDCLFIKDSPHICRHIKFQFVSCPNADFQIKQFKNFNPSSSDNKGVKNMSHLCVSSVIALLTE